MMSAENVETVQAGSRALREDGAQALETIGLRE
jgi:hypothetical protein